MGKALKITGLVLLGLASYAYMNPDNRTPEQKAKDATEQQQLELARERVRSLKDSMHDAGSFELVQVYEVDGRWCVTFRARNAFGALRLGNAVVSRTRIDVSGNDGFTQTWNKRCGGKSGTDVTAALNWLL